MMVDLTNFLLACLIGLLAYIGNIYYQKIKELIDEIRTIMLSDVANKKDIESLKNITADHEERISKIEDKI